MYEPLSVTKREVRLLVINRSASLSTANLKCCLKTVSLSNCESFVALSYAWGDRNDTAWVTINGRAQKVTINLFSALQHLSRMAARLVIWVDAVCINQNDARERADQVRMMADIYKSAEHVLVWLGLADADIILGLDMIKALGNAYHDSKSPEAALKSIEENYGSKQEQVWTGILQILSRPWWGRLWTVQEAVLGSQVSLICGTKSISWNAFYHAVVVLNDLDAVVRSKFMPYLWHALPRAINHPHVRAKTALWSWENSTLSELKSPLHTVLSLCRSFGALDHRDKIYACIGLAPTIPGLEIDYLKPFHLIYHEFTISYIIFTMNLDVLREAGLGTSARDPTVPLPSWVPDWRYERTSTLLIVADDLYDASGSTTASVSFSPDKIILSGILLDQVTSTANFEPKDEREWLKLALHNQPAIYEPLGIPRLQAYFRTKHLDLNLAHETRLDPKQKSFYDAVAWFTAPLGLQYSDSLPDYMSKFAAEHGLSLMESLLPQMLPQGDPEVHDAYWQWDDEMLNPPRTQVTLPEVFSGVFTYEAKIKSMLWGRCFIMTSQGYMGIAPKGTESGDHICIFLGCKVPLVLRPAQTAGEFVLIGECFVLGMMHGEPFEDGELEKRSEKITLL